MGTSEVYDLNIYDYSITPEFIAQYPADQRDNARLLIIDQEGSIEHKIFSDIRDYFRPGDILVLNDTKVIPARLKAIKEDTGGKVDLLLLKEIGEEKWEVLCNRKLRHYQIVSIGNGILRGHIINKNGRRFIHFQGKGVNRIIRELGLPPLPPYIKRNGSDPESPESSSGLSWQRAQGSGFDRERYQTVYAEKEGSLAAPTAGLHFTDLLLKEISNIGVRIVKVTLHIGPGTFRPVTVEDIRHHRMEPESFHIPFETANVINRAKTEGKKIIAVGTTTTRALESASDNEGWVNAGSGSTNLFIYPGYTFKVIDSLITNFHLPKSTLLMLVSALVGLERIKDAYNEAIEKGYRFYSYGDAMLILHPSKDKFSNRIHNRDV